MSSSLLLEHLRLAKKKKARNLSHSSFTSSENNKDNDKKRNNKFLLRIDENNLKIKNQQSSDQSLEKQNDVDEDQDNQDDSKLGGRRGRGERGGGSMIIVDSNQLNRNKRKREDMTHGKELYNSKRETNIDKLKNVHFSRRRREKFRKMLTDVKSKKQVDYTKSNIKILTRIHRKFRGGKKHRKTAAKLLKKINEI